jgi:hypothetical protein
LADAVVWCFEWEDICKIGRNTPVIVDLERLLLSCYLSNMVERSLHRFFTVEEQYLFLIKRQRNLIEQVPSVFLANYLGTTPETISRVRAKIKEGGDIPDISPLEYLFLKQKNKFK